LFFVAIFWLVFRLMAKRVASLTEVEKAKLLKGVSDKDIQTAKRIGMGCVVLIGAAMVIGFALLVYSRHQERVVVDPERFHATQLGQSDSIRFDDVQSMVIVEVAPRLNERSARDIPSYLLRCSMKSGQTIDVLMNGPAMHAAVREILERARARGVSIRESDLLHQPKEWQIGQQAK
jgi:hypothetical protein